MLSGEGNAGERWKTTVGLISKKSNFARVGHFFVHFFAVVLHDYNFQKRFSYTFLGGNVVLVLVHFFSLPLIFTLHWWPLSFLIFPHRRYKIFMLFFQQKNCLLFLSLVLDLCRPFSRLASLICRLFSLFLCLSLALYSKFVDMTINLSLIL